MMHLRDFAQIDLQVLYLKACGRDCSRCESIFSRMADVDSLSWRGNDLLSILSGIHWSSESRRAIHGDFVALYLHYAMRKHLVFLP